MSETQPDRIAIKQQLSLLGCVDWWTLRVNIIFRHFKYLFSVCWRGEMLTKIPLPEHRTPLPRPKSLSGLGH